MDELFTDRPDAELIGACLDGNEKAWQMLVSRYRRLVYSIPIKWGIRPEDATDIFQSVWVDCFQQLASLRDLERLQPWLIRVAVRKCYRFTQQSRARAEDPLPDDGLGLGTADEDPSSLLIAELERDQILRTAIERLSPRCRQVIHCLFFEDPRPSYATIASRLGLSDNSIGFTRERCLNNLRKILKDLGYLR